MVASSSLASSSETRSLLRTSFVWMTIGLVIAAVVAWYVSQTDALSKFVVEQPVASIAAFIGWIVLSVGFGFFVRRLPMIFGVILFLVYSGFTGLTLSWIFTAYTNATILYALVSTVALFGVITAFALFTSVDLTRWWWYIIIGIIGLGIASLLNAFVFRSDTLDFVLSLVGVGLFSISTAATVQRIVHMEAREREELHGRVAIVGAMMLFTNFINLFIRLLSIYSRLQNERK